MSGFDTQAGPDGDEGPDISDDAITDRATRIAQLVFFGCASVTVLTTFGIIFVLISGSIPFLQDISPVTFLTGTTWSPLIDPVSFGVLELVWGTLMIVVGSAVIAIPIGILTAIYLSEYADERIRKVFKPTLEILAGVPTIVYGFFALSFITPQLQRFFPETGTFNAASGAIVVAIMILPMVSSLSEDAMSAVPDDLRQAAYGVGATKLDVSTRVVVPAALSGILASFVLAISRAIGETMAVTLAAGQNPNITVSPFEEIQTMTAYMVQVATSDVSTGEIAYQSLFAVGLLLFCMTLAMNLVSQWIRGRYREVYD